MTNPAYESTTSPFINFRFEVILNLETSLNGVASPICDAAFSECSGLEMTMEPKTITQLGDHRRQIHRIGSVSYGRLTLRRGMTSNTHLWAWFDNAVRPGKNTTASGEIRVMQSDGTPAFTLELKECLPTRLSGPSLNARNGDIAIEEMQLVYAEMKMKRNGAAGGSLGVSASFDAGFSAGASGVISGGLTGGISGGVSGHASGSLDGSLKVGGEAKTSGGFSFP
jgi:phage tail-like protein